MYLSKKGQWCKYNKPKLGKQFGFFGTLKDGHFGEVHWGDGNIVRRGFSKDRLFAWLHDNVDMMFWGDMQIKEIKDKEKVVFT